MNLSINWLQLDFSPQTVRLPANQFSNWEETTSLIRGRLKDSQPVRQSHRDGKGENILLALVSGSEIPEGWSEREFDLYNTPFIAKRVAQLAVTEYLKSHGATVYGTRFDLIATRHAGEFSDLGVLLKTGVRLRFFAPQSTLICGFTANWEVRAEFTRTLEDTRLRSICRGMPVVLTGAEDAAGLPSTLTEYLGRFVGEVISVIDDQTIEVWTRTEERLLLPAKNLRLEAKPSVMRELEHAAGMSEQSRSIFRRIQELKLVLANGRRNLNVLRDQVRAIRHFFGPDAADSLVFPVLLWQQRISVAMRLVPAPVQIGGAR
jgi:hypothetical protein